VLFRSPLVLALAGLAVMPLTATVQFSPAATTTARATLLPTSRIVLPGTVDSNSPAIWDIDDGEPTLFVMTSNDGEPSLSTGAGITRLGAAEEITMTPHPGNGVWMEAVVSDGAGTWYGYYHNEIPAVACGRPDRTVARIGAARSTDRGRTWTNLGIILEAAPDTVACDSRNRYVIGGVGDLSVMLDANKTDLYLFVSQYGKAASDQGVAVGRLLWADRDRPVGRVTVWNDGVWERGRWSRQPVIMPDGMRRRVWFDYPEGTPLVPVSEAWHDGNNAVDAFWGPSVHWNEYLQQYVMLLNRARDENYTQEGIYVSFAPRLDDPELWSEPRKLLNGGRWYPQVIGLEPEEGTDKTAGATARFFMSGESEYVIAFTRQ